MTNATFLANVLDLGVFLWVFGLAVQIFALVGQTDPYIDVRWAEYLSMFLIYPEVLFVELAYILRSGGGRRWVGYMLLVLGVIFTAVLVVLGGFLANLFMPMVATPAMLLVNSVALLFAAGVYPSLRKAWKKTFAAPAPTPVRAS